MHKERTNETGRYKDKRRELRRIWKAKSSGMERANKELTIAQDKMGINSKQKLLSFSSISLEFQGFSH